MKLEILFPTIERWHCIDLVLKCFELAEKPRDTQILAVIQSGDEYKEYVEKGLKKIFDKVRIVHRKEKYLDHDTLRISKRKTGSWTQKENYKKTLQVEKTYKQLVKHADKSVDCYWVAEDDTLFPLNFFTKAHKLMDALDADAVAGVSYRWRSNPPKNTNFCDINLDEEGVTSFEVLDKKESGVVRLGMTGLSGMLAKKDCILSWKPTSIKCINSGADVSFSLNMEGKRFFGCWDLSLPHITKYENGDIQILGRIDKSLLPLFNKKI